jgi:transcriptional regulator with XRE-family HTH domain
MGMLWDLIQRHIDKQPYPPSERQVAAKLGVAPNALKYWRDPKKLPSRENLQAIANLVGARYAVVLDAALMDTGYHEAAPAAVVPLRPRPVAAIEAELRVAMEDLADWDAQKVPGQGAKSHRAELRARVDVLEAELVSSRQATGASNSVAEL